MQHRRPPIDPHRVLMVHLEAQEWNTVQSALVELPYRISSSIIGKLVDQLNQQAYPPDGPADEPKEKPAPEPPAPKPKAMRVSGGLA